MPARGYRMPVTDPRVARMSYLRAHHRIHFHLSSASNHPCVSCGKQARDWAYDHGDPDERFDTFNGTVFSVRLEHYRPMCSPCHREFDASQPWDKRGGKGINPRPPLIVPEAALVRARENPRMRDIMSIAERMGRKVVGADAARILDR